ncbi:hypothetical protein [Flexivirga sp.]|uniref:hypothetical protein n=1 Tax=Flexivirga sp. TaxID=1962927 RepID=UPI003F7E7D35
MTALAVASHPHTVRATIAKAAAGTVLLAAAAAGVYVGAHAIGERLTRSDTSHAVSYADRAIIDARLAGAWHTPATAGDFRPTADIRTPDVVSVVQVVQP